MPPDETIRQDIKDIKDSIKGIQTDVNDIKVEIGKHHEKFKFMHERVTMLNDRVDNVYAELSETKKEVRNFRTWIFSSVIAALLSLVGAMVGVIRWLFEKA